MEIPGLFPHFHVCESDCGATVLHSAKASTEMLGALRTSLCPYPKRQLHSQLRNGAGFEHIQSNQGLRCHEYPGKDEDFGTTPDPCSCLPPSQAAPLPHLGCRINSNLLRALSPAQELFVPGPSRMKAC